MLYSGIYVHTHTYIHVITTNAKGGHESEGVGVYMVRFGGRNFVIKFERDI